MKARNYILLVITILILYGCAKHSFDSRLRLADSLTECNPQRSYEILDSIDRGTLSEADKYYFDLLTIKTKDKSRQRLDNDSSILKVIEYFEKCGIDSIYAEALYYGGRTYICMGDYPSALENLQKAADLMPSDYSLLKKRSNIYAQIGNVYSRLRLYSEAEKAYQKTLEYDLQREDSVRYAEEMLYLGGVYLTQNNLHKADSIFSKALGLSHLLSRQSIETAIISHAAVLNQKQKYKEALETARSINLSDSIKHSNFTLAYLSKIYLDAGITDTAYMYANILLKNGDNASRMNAYEILITEEMRPYYSLDSLHSMINSYQHAVKEYNESHEADAVISQSNIYNYQQHLANLYDAKIKIESLKTNISITIIALVICLMIALIASNVALKKDINLRKTLEDLDTLRKILNNNLIAHSKEETGVSSESDSSQEGSENHLVTSPIQEPDAVKTDTSEPEGIIMPHSDEAETIQDKIQKQIESISTNIIKSPGVSFRIMESNTYQKLIDRLSKDKWCVINEKDSLWEEIENEIKVSSSHFKENIHFFIGKEPSYMEYHIALLIKFGMSPSRVASLVGRDKSTVTHYRNVFKRTTRFSKIVEKFGIDEIIRHL